MSQLKALSKKAEHFLHAQLMLLGKTEMSQICGVLLFSIQLESSVQVPLSLTTGASQRLE